MIQPWHQWDLAQFRQHWGDEVFNHQHQFDPQIIDGEATVRNICPTCLVSYDAWQCYHALTQDQAEVQPWQDWWLQHAKDTIVQMSPKVTEYSSADLTWIGQQMAQTLGREVDEEQATELGIYWYALSKFGRWVGAVRDGHRPSDDTISDIATYCTMALRNRDAGRWPGSSRSEAETKELLQ